MKQPVQVTLGRTHRNDGEMMHLEIRDTVSGIEFLDVQTSLEDFAKMITGLGHVEWTGEIRGLEYIGKTRVTEDREIVCPLKTYDRERQEQWLVDNAQEPGWILNSYLRSRASVTTNKNGQTVLHYSVVKYVELPKESK